MGDAALLAVGSMVGGMLRHWLVGIIARLVHDGFPWGTLAVNVSGALGIGVLGGLAVTGGMLDAGAALFLSSGMLGSYTTVSSFTLQTLLLWEQGRRFVAVMNVSASFITCLLAAGAGYALSGGSG